MTAQKKEAALSNGPYPRPQPMQLGGMRSIPDTPAEYIHLPSGFRVIHGLGFPPKRTPPRAGAVRRRWWSILGFAASIYAIALSILFGGYAL